MKNRSVIETLALSMCLAFASEAAAEQNQKNTGAEQEATSPGDPMPAAGSATAGQGQAANVDPSTKQFVISAAGGGIAEVEMGRLALGKSSDPDVKEHAQKMIDDHTKANAELERIASAKGIAVPKEADAKHKETLQRLSGLDGKEFDREYIREGGVKAHREMQQLFKTQAESGKDPEVQAFARKTLPVVEEHLKHSQMMADGDQKR
jgi:putative membrane protein